jgi:hypothetical protein
VVVVVGALKIQTLAKLFSDLMIWMWFAPEVPCFGGLELNAVMAGSGI